MVKNGVLKIHHGKILVALNFSGGAFTVLFTDSYLWTELINLQLCACQVWLWLFDWELRLLKVYNCSANSWHKICGIFPCNGLYKVLGREINYFQLLKSIIIMLPIFNLSFSDSSAFENYYYRNQLYCWHVCKTNSKTYIFWRAM